MREKKDTRARTARTSSHLSPSSYTYYVWEMRRRKGLIEEFVLGSEVVVDPGDVDLGLAGDIADRDAAVAAFGEQFCRRHQKPIASAAVAHKRTIADLAEAVSNTCLKRT